MRAAVIGLGTMGMGAALNLARKGHAVTGIDPRRTVWPELEAAGGTCSETAARLPEGIEAALVLVVNAAQVAEVLDACLDRLAADAVVICSTTLAPDAATRLAERVAATGRQFLDAPVSGGLKGARDGTMTVMASGTDGRLRPCRARCSTRSPARSGASARRPASAAPPRWSNQLLAGVHIAVAAEALALGIRAGADPRTLFEVISSSAGSSWMWQNRVPHVLAGDDTPLSAVNIFVKDLGIVLDQARALTFPLPLAAAAHQLFLAAAASGHGGRDDAFVIRVWQALTGIPLPEKPPG